MGWRTKYDVEFKGLKEGLHEFEFEVKDAFFEHFEQGLVTFGDIRVMVTLEKRSSFIKLFFKMKGWVELTCDRCLENYRQKIKHKSELFVKYGDNDYEDDEIIWILPEEHRINLAQLIYEYIILSIPIRHVHPDKKGATGCNLEMLEQLKKYEQKKEEPEEITDPRWAALKNWNNN
ncbi:MAG TPA: DUF177 domain-containing protein [Mariniphaga anaerophila]|uniref:DUF177 domain-containing protein n=1 Tax=Mariniphaga anaerophila TaxID=1484053 RepID=A0A831LKE2_9BACT|nr:DUF177 domain-containing protein [Mariniphaga anaerophila]